MAMRQFLPNSGYNMLGQMIQSSLKQAGQALQKGAGSAAAQSPRNVRQVYQAGTYRNVPAAGSDTQSSGPFAPPSGSGTVPGPYGQRTGGGSSPAGSNTAAAGIGSAAEWGSAAADPNASGGTSGMNPSSAANAPSARSGRTGNAGLPKTAALKFNFTQEGLLSGIVMAEVFGKPKCLRRGRW